jgi:glycerol uptake facilitator protein
MLGEFMGTLILILLGDGVVAGVLLKRSKAENSGWIVVTAGWAFAVLCGIYTALLFGSTDAHINPAITLAFALQSGDYSKLLPYVTAQLAGGFCGAVLVWLFYLPHWKLTENAEMKRFVFCTSPAVRLSCEPAVRVHCDLCAGHRCRRDELKTGSV